MNTPPVASPCNSTCRISEQTGFCEGCFRTLDEIATWGQLNETKKQHIAKQLKARRQLSGDDHAA